MLAFRWQGSTSPLGDLQDVVSYLEEAERTVAVHDMCFGTVLRGSWWSFVKITTVARFYGDCFPVRQPFALTLTMYLTLALPLTPNLTPTLPPNPHPLS